MGGVDNIRDNISLALTMIVFIMFIGIIFIWGYNFMVISDDKLFDDNNKYIDPSLANPDVDGNYKDTYLNKNKFDLIWLSLMSFFSSLKGIFVIAFLFIFFIGLILKNRKTILDNFQNMFN